MSPSALQCKQALLMWGFTRGLRGLHPLEVAVPTLFYIVCSMRLFVLVWFAWLLFVGSST